MRQIKRDSLASKYPKLALLNISKEIKEEGLKTKIHKIVEQAYIDGFNLAVRACRDDNSKAGESIADYLETLEDTNE